RSTLAGEIKLPRPLNAYVAELTPPRSSLLEIQIRRSHAAPGPRPARVLVPRWHEILFFLFSSAAPMNAAKSGCGSSGLDLNSGWNWQPRNHGWSGASTISTKFLSGDTPEMISPCSVNVFSNCRLNSYRCRWRSEITVES